MAEGVVKKKYYKVKFTLASPLALGSGENDNTDNDLIRDASGRPYIPASSIAGVVREKLEKNEPLKVKKYLGDVDKNTGDGNASQIESAIIFYDATLTSNDYHITVRDSVALDEYKTAKDGAKFDMEVLEPGVGFETYIEQSYTEEREEDYGAEIARVFITDEIVFGGKSMRGYGAIKEVSVDYREFDLTRLSKQENYWLLFDIYTNEEWKEYILEKEETALKSRKLTLELKQQGGISIRRYTTRVSSKEGAEPDMEQLTVDINSELVPVIPGTSWAGAIRHRMKEFGIEVDGRESIFGYVTGNGADDKARSSIRSVNHS